MGGSAAIESHCPGLLSSGPTREYQRNTSRSVIFVIRFCYEIAFKQKNVRQREDWTTVQKPGFPLLERLCSELGFLLDCDFILRHEHCENRDTLCLKEPVQFILLQSERYE